MESINPSKMIHIKAIYNLDTDRIKRNFLLRIQ